MNDDDLFEALTFDGQLVTVDGEAFGMTRGRSGEREDWQFFAPEGDVTPAELVDRWIQWRSWRDSPRREGPPSYHPGEWSRRQSDDLVQLLAEAGYSLNTNSDLQQLLEDWVSAEAVALWESSSEWDEHFPKLHAAARERAQRLGVPWTDAILRRSRHVD